MNAPARLPRVAFKADLTPGVALVSMPFASADRPSIQIGLLAELARGVGWHATTHHLNLDLAALIGLERYRVMAAHRGRQFGDWLFSPSAFGSDAPDPDGTAMLGAHRADVERWLIDIGDDCDGAWLMRLRNVLLPAYIASAAEGLALEGISVVGFTSTFQQNAASFALARALKARHPDLICVFGGANFDGVMGPAWCAGVDCVDIAVIGEADAAFPALLSALSEGRDPLEIPGVVIAGAGGEVICGPEPVPFERMDTAPIPDYTEFFERSARLDLHSAAVRRALDIPIEGARGCWWGAKHHCTFCGLNGASMTFRAKSPDRLLSELHTLAARHGSFNFEAVDNIIDMNLFDGALSRLAEGDNGFDLFYEVKANLSRERLAALSHAGVRRVQPGIESFSSDVLKLMRKGITGIQNVNFLRWARHEGINASWNLLWGFPGEAEAEYTRQAALLPNLRHLQPPTGGGRVWMERFSPLFRTRPDDMEIQPEASYALVYPGAIDMDRAAYFFDYEGVGALPDEAYAPLLKAMSDWAVAWEADKRPRMFHRGVPGFTEIEDARDPDNAGLHRLEGATADVYRAFVDRPLGVTAAMAASNDTLDAQAAERLLDGLVERGVMMRDGKTWLALSLPAPKRRRP